MSEEEKSGNVISEEFLTPGERPGVDDLSIVAGPATIANNWSNSYKSSLQLAFSISS
jgi:hypothetical protein